MKTTTAAPQALYPVLDRGLDRLETLFQICEEPVRDDLNLCFLCLRWSSGDEDCRNGVRCAMQLEIDRLDKPS
jgi:hypothetical protein